MDRIVGNSAQQPAGEATPAKEPGPGPGPASAQQPGPRAPAIAPVSGSEECLRRLIESFAQALWETSAAGELVADCPAWRAQTGQSFEQWAGAGWLDAIHPEDRAEVEQRWREAVAAGYIIDVEFRLRDAAGGWRWTQVWATPVRAPDGAILKWCGMNIDIHSRRRTEDALRKSEERQAFLLKLSDALRPLADPVAIQEVAARLLGKHIAASRVGYAETQADGETVIVTRHYIDGVPGIEGRYRYEDYGPALLRELRAGRAVVRPDVANDPTLTDAEKRAHAALQLGAMVNVPLVKGGRLLAVLFLNYREAHAFSAEELLLLQDVGERTWAAVERARAEAALRESEKKYRTLFETMYEGFLVSELVRDGTGQVVNYRHIEVNPALERLTGLRRDAVLGRLGSEVLPDRYTSWMRISERVVASGEPIRLEFHSELLQRWFDISVSPYGDDRVIVLYDDITARKQAECVLHKNAERQAFLLQLGDALRSLAPADEIKAVAARLLGQHLASDRVYYAEIEPNDEYFVIPHGYYSSGRSMLIAGRYRIKDFSAFVYRTLCANHPVVLADTPAVPDETEAERVAYRTLDIGAFIGFPLVKGGRLVAILGVTQSSPRAWTDEELARTGETAERTWAAVERARAEEALRRANDQLEQHVAERTNELALAVQQLWVEAREREAAESARSELRRKLDTAHEDERRRVARDLHDQTGQLLAELALAVRAVATAGSPAPAAVERLADLQRVADELGRQVHGLAVRLRPTALDDVGLAAALRQLTADWSARTRVSVDLEALELEPERLPPEVETVIYRVVQEALTNIAKHAAATQVSVVVTRQDGAACLIVEDDGRGFEPGQAGAGRLGLVGMRERVTLAGGELMVESAAGSGTSLIVRLPLRPEKERP